MGTTTTANRLVTDDIEVGEHRPEITCRPTYYRLVMELGRTLTLIHTPQHRIRAAHHPAGEFRRNYFLMDMWERCVRDWVGFSIPADRTATSVDCSNGEITVNLGSAKIRTVSVSSRESSAAIVARVALKFHGRQTKPRFPMAI
ncbi:hypothetical protein ACFWBG_30125 [Nocardia salmonicida]|uniref:hypothetical protein n=1 Tax=Nocardia salmonicida TaxID=53431 RepID=UPI00366B54AD